jgi:hypothetical protein
MSRTKLLQAQTLGPSYSEVPARSALKLTMMSHTLCPVKSELNSAQSAKENQSIKLFLKITVKKYMV